MAGYSKLFSSIVTSSVWCEDDKTFRVWIAMLAMCDASGHVDGSIPGFARLTGATIAEMEHAIERLTSPDPYSRTSDNEGRRIAPEAGGWKILNYAQYREKGQSKDGSRAEYMRRYRAGVTRNNSTSHDTAPASASASALPGETINRDTTHKGQDWAPPAEGVA